MLVGRGLFREIPGQHELGFEYCAGRFDDAVQRRCHPFDHGVCNPFLHAVDGPTGVALEPAPVKILGNGAKLDDKVVGEVFGLDLAALLAP